MMSTRAVLPQTMSSAIVVASIALAACGGSDGALESTDLSQPQSATSPLKASVGDNGAPKLVVGWKSAVDDSGRVDVSGTVRDDVGVTRVAWSSDHGLSGIAMLEGDARRASWSVRGLQLQVGGNLLTIVAEDIAGNRSVTHEQFTYLPALGTEAGQDEAPPPPPPPPPTPTPPPPPPPLPAILLDGSGVRTAFASGCTPTLYDDFVDSGSWNARRLEPRDCAVVQLATPVFSWPQPADRNLGVAWTFELRQASGSVIATRTSAAPRLLLSDLTLSTGSYTWTVSYTKAGGSVVTSKPRRFEVKGGATTLTQIPSGAAIAASVSVKARPRTLPAGASPSTIAAAAASGEYSASYAAFVGQAANFALQPPAPVPKNLVRADFANDLDYYNWLSALAHQAMDERRAIETLGYSALLTGNTAHASAGKTRLLSLATWPADGATSEATQDQANREIYLALGLGLDLFQHQLNSAQRGAVVTALKARLGQAWSKFPTFDTAPYNSHLVTATHYVMQTLVHAAGTPEFPESQVLLAGAWETWVTMLGAWGGSDGGFGNAVAYNWYATAYAIQAITTAKLAAGVDLTGWPAVGGLGASLMAFATPVANFRGQFGDGVETTTNYANYSYNEFRLYAGTMRQSQYEWYWRAYAPNVSTRAALPPLHYMLLGIAGSKPAAAAPTVASQAFDDAGVVAMHSKADDASRTSVFFRSSRFGSYNHSHADNNAFTFVSKGTPLLISGGYYPYYGSPHHLAVGRATRFKNAVTFDGGIGQAEPTPAPTVPGNPVFSMDARGELINFADTGAWSATTGDASLAYRGQNLSTGMWTPLLTSAVRTVAFQRNERVVVIYDWATSATPRSWELNFQSLTAPSLSSKTLRLANGSASACIDVYGLTGNFKLTSGFPIAPETALPNQFQARFAADAPSQELIAVTVIREDCRSVPIDVRITGSTATVGIDTAPPIILDRKAVSLPAS